MSQDTYAACKGCGMPLSDGEHFGDEVCDHCHREEEMLSDRVGPDDGWDWWGEDD